MIWFSSACCKTGQWLWCTKHLALLTSSRWTVLQNKLLWSKVLNVCSFYSNYHWRFVFTPIMQVIFISAHDLLFDSSIHTGVS